MDPEIKKLLSENLALAKENNTLLQKLARSARRSNIYRVVYWSILILSSVGALYFVQVFFDKIKF